MSYFVLLPRIQVRGANALAGQLVVNAAPVMAVNLFAHNLGRHTGLFPTGVAILHHSADMLGEHFYQFQPQQRRGAVLIDKNDYPAGSQSLAMQPGANFHWQVSLLLCFDEEPEQHRIERFMVGARLAGGQVLSMQPLRCSQEPETLRPYLKSGYWLLERPDLMPDEATDGDFLTEWVAVLGRRASRRQPLAASEAESPAEANLLADDTEVEEDGSWTTEAEQGAAPPPLPESWLLPTVLGYAAITDFAPRGGVRDGLPHAYGEALYGLVQYVSVRDFGSRSYPLWHMSWPQPDVFTVSCHWQ